MTRGCVGSINKEGRALALYPLAELIDAFIGQMAPKLSVRFAPSSGLGRLYGGHSGQHRQWRLSTSMEPMMPGGRSPWPCHPRSG
jgi:hypothetical protein